MEQPFPALTGRSHLSPRRKFVIALLTIMVFTAMIAWAGPARLAGVFRNFGWGGVLWLFVIYQASQVLRALRLHGALPAESRPGWLPLIGIVSLHQFLNHVMPVRLGELSLPLLLRRFSAVDASEAVAALVIVRLQEIFVLVLLFLLAVAGLREEVAGGHRIEWLTFGAFCTAGLAGLRAALPWLLGRVRSVLSRVAGSRSSRPAWLMRASGFIDRLRSNLSLPISRPKRFTFFLLTVAIWLNTFFLFHETLHLSGIPLRFSQTIVGSAFANLTQTLPINTFGSFGSLEAGWTIGFSLLGIKTSAALATGLAMHVLVVGFLALSAMISWLALNAWNGRRLARLARPAA